MRWSTSGPASRTWGDVGARGPVAGHGDRRIAAGSSEVARAVNNLAVSKWTLGDLRAGRELMGEAVEHAERLGLANLARFSRNVELWLMFREGDWDAALPETEEFLAACEAGMPHYHEGGMRLRRADVRLARDDLRERSTTSGRSCRSPGKRGTPSSGCRGSRAAHGSSSRPARSTRHGSGPRGARRGGHEPSVGSRRSRVRRERSRCADELAAALERGAQTKWIEASRAALEGDFLRAAGTLHEIGDVTLEAAARSGRRAARSRRSARAGRRAAATRARVLALRSRDALHPRGRGAARRRVLEVPA